MAAIVQKGTAVVVGFNSRDGSDATLGTTWIMEDASQEATAEAVTQINDQHNAPVTKLISGPGKRYTITGILLAADLGAVEALIIGSKVVIDGKNCMVESAVLNFVREAAKATVTAISDGITYG